MVWSWYPQILLATAFSLVFVIIHLINRRRRGVLPVSWPLVGVLPAIIVNFHHIHEYSTTLLREAKGTVVFSGPGSLGMEFIFTCDLANVNHILNLHPKHYPKGIDFLEIFDVFGSGIFNADGESWKLQRNMALPVFKSRRFQSSVVSSSESKVEKALVPLLNAMAAERGKTFDLQDVFLRFTFDVTCISVLGIDLGSLAPDFPTIPFAKATDVCEHVFLLRHLVPKAWWKLMRWLDVGAEKKYRMASLEIDRFVGRRIKEARQEANNNTSCITLMIGENVQHVDMLRTFMNHTPYKEGKGGDVRSDKFLRDLMVNVMTAGKDTTGVGLSWFFWLLSKNPDVEAKILRELKESRRSNNFNSIIEEDQKFSGAGKLVYLHACLCETLRLYPPVPYNRKHSLRTDVLPSGHKVANGTEILISMYSMGRMETVWGKDCLEFRPERWITEDGREFRQEPLDKFIAFSSGPRTCIGKDVSFCQMKIVAAAVISDFQIHVVEGHVVEPKLSVVLHMENGLMVRVTKRQ